MRGSFRLTDALAALRLFSGPLPGAGPGAGGDPGAGVRTVGGAGASAVHLEAPTLPAALGPAGWTEESRRSVADPLGRDSGARPAAPSHVGRPQRVWLPFLEGDSVRTRTAPARQVDPTTCGSAVLAMLAMAGDPRLSAWVAADPAPRFAELQRRAHRQTSRAGMLPWPQRLGTAPWGAATVARHGQVRYTHRVVGRGKGGAAVLRAAVTAAGSGTPVPLFTGGDLSGGWRAAVPRHVVLLVDAGDDVVRVYEPSSATMHTVPTGVLLVSERAWAGERAVLTSALGGWPHVVWAALPGT